MNFTEINIGWWCPICYEWYFEMPHKCKSKEIK